MHEGSENKPIKSAKNPLKLGGRGGGGGAIGGWVNQLLDLFGERLNKWEGGGGEGGRGS